MNGEEGSELETKGEGQREREDKEARRREQGYLDAFKKNIPCSPQQQKHESPYIVELSPWNQKADENAFSNAIQKVMNCISRSEIQRKSVTNELWHRFLI